MALVLKFGGASLKDASSVKNMADIVNSFNENLIIVVSAMGKITRQLHLLTEIFFNGRSFESEFEKFWEFHQAIINDLGLENDLHLKKQLNSLKNYLNSRLSRIPSTDFDYEYDQIVCCGELLSSLIVSSYLNKDGINCKWVDIRDSLKTNSIYRDARINWDESEKSVLQNFDFKDNRIYLTQGFIASNEKNKTTTLGLEGSDYTAAALAFFVNANRLIVWKDVSGIYNSDPNEFKDSIKLDSISYYEAVELAYYGAKVIHPKTIKPLENKNIPLWVKSFKNPHEPGTVITASTDNKRGVSPEVPVFIFKNSQILISIAPNDFSFIAEDNLEHIFSILARYRIKVNLMQNSAISFSVCSDDEEDKIAPAIEMLKKDFKVLYNNNLTLITIRHFNDQTIEQTTKEKEILVQQKSRNTIRFVVR
jgi:aspartate kinase